MRVPFNAVTGYVSRRRFFGTVEAPRSGVDSRYRAPFLPSTSQPSSAGATNILKKWT